MEVAGRAGDWRQTEVASKAHFNGYRRLVDPHQNRAGYLFLPAPYGTALVSARAEAVPLPSGLRR
jgi:hypothetical protein